MSEICPLVQDSSQILTNRLDIEEEDKLIERMMFSGIVENEIDSPEKNIY